MAEDSVNESLSETAEQITKSSIWGLFKIPGMVIAAITSIGVVLFALGFTIQTPGQALRHHVDETHTALDSVVSQLLVNQQEQNDLMMALIRGYCIEQPRETLARAGLLDTCQGEGIFKEE